LVCFVPRKLSVSLCVFIVTSPCSTSTYYSYYAQANTITVQMWQIHWALIRLQKNIWWARRILGNSSYIFHTLTSDDGIPVLNVQLIEKVKISWKQIVFWQNSNYIYNWIMVKSLYSIYDQENCGSLIRDDKGFDNRLSIECFYF
jgi:hypothetical protein